MTSSNGANMSQCVSEEYLRECKKKIGKEWKDVGRHLGFSDAELDHFEEDNSKHVEEAIYQMLFSWKKRRGNDATVDNLEKILEKYGRQMSPEESLNQSNGKKELLIHHLKKTYRKWLRTIRPIPMKKNRKFKLENLFMDLGLALLDQTCDSSDPKSWTSLKTYIALFEHPELNEEDSKIIIEGDPGSGKTTLLYYLAHLWCENDKIMEDVKLFVLLPLRRVKSRSTIDESIVDVLLRACGGELTETDIQHILRNESGMILALDGLDEYSGLKDADYESTGVMTIIREESEYVSPDVKVILTTRPTCLPFVHDCDVKRLKLEKLQDIHRETYLEKVFPGEEGEVKRRIILETINENYFIKAYCNLPLWFTLIVQTMRDDLQRDKGIKLDSVSEFFKYLLKGLRGHFVNKDRPDQGDIDSPKLEQIAFNGLLKESLKTIWNKQDLDAVEKYDTLVEIGTLVEEEDLDSDVMYNDASMAPKTVTFLHRTFQEWYGAKHLAKLSTTPDVFYQRLKQVMQSFNTLHLLYFTCGISSQAAKRIMNYVLTETQRSYNSSIILTCILEYKGEECQLKDIVTQLCETQAKPDLQDMFAILSKDDTLHLKSKLTVFRLAHKLKVTIDHIDLKCHDMTSGPPDKVMVRKNIEISPLSAKVITVHRWYGQSFFNFLRKCDNLKQLRIKSDTFPKTPQEIRKRLQGLKIEVFWEMKNPFPGSLQENVYIMKDNEWEFVKDYPRDCCNCRKPIVGLFWECRNSGSFYTRNFNLSYICDTCKDGGFHMNHSHRLGKEFDEKRLPSAGTPAELKRLQLPHVFVVEREKHMIVCSGCQEADVTLVRFECKTCVNFHLCKLCKNNYPHNHDLIKQVYHIFWRCSDCKGKIYGSRFARRGYTLCEICYRKSNNSSQAFVEIKEPGRFKLRRCENCKATGEINKVWFRCDTCDRFLLCERCKNGGFHKKHNFIRQFFRDVNCDECGRDTVLLFRCNTCGGRNLCIICQAKHQRHSIEEIKKTEVKHDGFRCHNCQNQICGIRYKCTSCFGFVSICKFCKDRGIHSERHSFIEEEWTSHCHYCLQKIHGPGYKCTVCRSYNLCENCNSNGIHRNHELTEFHEEEVHHTGVRCKKCFNPSIYGSRYRCTTCVGYDICQECKVKGLHPEHKLIEIKHAELYHDKECDRCHAAIHDIRYKCKKCKQYNLCKYCIKEEGSTGHKIVEGEESSACCRRCSRDIFGPAYLCESCNVKGYSIVCKDCKLILSNENNCKHEFVELREKEVQHKYIHCNLCKKYQFRGIRYRCKTCKWYNLCEYCKQSGHHNHHEFQEWKTSQFLPGPGNNKSISLVDPFTPSSSSLSGPSRLPYVYGVLPLNWYTQRVVIQERVLDMLYMGK